MIGQHMNPEPSLGFRLHELLVKSAEHTREGLHDVREGAKVPLSLLPVTAKFVCSLIHILSACAEAWAGDRYCQVV